MITGKMYTIYPGILAIIKFGDLRKIRLYFNIGENLTGGCTARTKHSK